MRLKGEWVVYSMLTLVLLNAAFWALFAKSHRTKHHVSVFLPKSQPMEAETVGRTVGEALRDLGIALKPQDMVVPSLSAPVTEGMEIDLGLVERKVQEIKKKVPAVIHTDYTDSLNTGEIIDVEKGKDGLEDQQVESYYLNGEEAFQKVLQSKVLVPMKVAKVIEGTALRQKMYPMKKRMRVVKTLTMEASAYYPGPEDTWPYAAGYTASGLKAAYGVVAVDTRLIRLKTPLYVEGYGFAIAADRGGGIKGSKIDLCYDTYEEAVRFGRKKIKVYILR